MWYNESRSFYRKDRQKAHGFNRGMNAARENISK